MRRVSDECGVVNLGMGEIAVDAAVTSRSRPDWPDDGVNTGSLERLDAAADTV